MKRGTPEHPKMLDLAEAIYGYLQSQSVPVSMESCETLAIGLIERLAHFTARYATAGDIGKHSNLRISRGLGWTWDADWLIDSLLRITWLDPEPGRLYVHDWHEHSDDYADRWLADEGLMYANGRPPRNRPRSGSKASRDASLCAGNADRPQSDASGDADPHADSTQPAGEPHAARAPSKPESKTVSKSKSKPAPKSYTPAFEAWFGVYPRRVAKEAAASAYGRAIDRIAVKRQCSKTDAHLWLMGVTQAFAASPAGHASEAHGDLQYVAYPASWLNQGRYDDDQAEWQRARKSNGKPAPKPGPGQRHDPGNPVTW